jgi:hypothetical protein
MSKEEREQAERDARGISDEDYERRAAAASQNEYAVVKTSRGRWALRRKRVHVGAFLVGRCPDGNHRYVIDWIAFEPVEDCENLTYGAAMGKLYDLMHPVEAAEEVGHDEGTR